jgi:hypothetical protein
MPTQNIPFLSLPGGIRNTIYELVNLDDDIPIPVLPRTVRGRQFAIDTLGHPTSTVFTHPGYLLTQTCRQVRHEAMSVYLASHTFDFELGEYEDEDYARFTLTWLDFIKASDLAHLRKFVFHGYESYDFCDPKWHTRRCVGRCIIHINLDVDTGLGIEDVILSGMAFTLTYSDRVPSGLVRNICNTCRSPYDRWTVKSVLRRVAEREKKEDGKGKGKGKGGAGLTHADLRGFFNAARADLVKEFAFGSSSGPSGVSGGWVFVGGEGVWARCA